MMHTPLQDASTYPVTAYTVDGGQRLALPALDTSCDADVVIIGGGIGGCSAALEAASRGASVVLMEANEIGWGASGRNAGHVAAATKHPPKQIQEIYGQVMGQRIIEASEDGPDLVFGLVDKHRMDVAYRRTGIVVALHTSAAMQAAERRVAELRGRGHPAEMLDRKQTAAKIGTDYYLGAWYDARGGLINPLAYARGLARAAMSAGARITERTKAVGIAPSGGRWRVTSEGGAAVTASKVIIATNAYGAKLWPGLEQSIIPVRAYQIVSKPLPKDVASTVLPFGGPMTDTRRLLSGLRIYPDGRMQLGARGPITGREKAPDIRTSLDRVKDIFPQIKTIECEHWWSGWMAMSTANAWKVHELAPGLMSMLGCNGRGVALGTVIGRELGRHVTGVAKDDLAWPIEPLKPIFGHRFHRLPLRALIKLYSFRDAAETRALKKSLRQSSTSAG